MVQNDIRYFEETNNEMLLSSQIWELVSGGKPALTREEFYLALKLIFLAQNGKHPTLFEAHNISGSKTTQTKRIIFLKHHD
jgi:hypothetical protein